MREPEEASYGTKLSVFHMSEFFNNKNTMKQTPRPVFLAQLLWPGWSICLGQALRERDPQLGFCSAPAIPPSPGCSTSSSGVVGMVGKPAEAWVQLMLLPQLAQVSQTSHQLNQWIYGILFCSLLYVSLQRPEEDVKCPTLAPLSSSLETGSLTDSGARLVASKSTKNK